MNPYDRLKRQAAKVQFTMLAITLVAVLTAFLLVGSAAAVSALVGGMINIVSVMVYSRLARVDPRYSAQQTLNRHLFAEVGKVAFALLALLACFFVRGMHLPALLLAFIASLLAYWMALIFYKN